MKTKHSIWTGYQLFMLILCLYALGALAAQSLIHFEPEARRILDYADYAVCALFLVDFLVSLHQAENRWRYFFSWGWLDLLSSIPSLDVARWGRFARVVRVFRVLRGLRATRILSSVVLKRRAENTFLAVSLVAILLIIFCSIAVLHFETEPDSNIKTADDAVWWAFATITTVGYGDRYPVTTEGRIVAGILMCAGVGLFGTFAGFLAAWFVGEPEAHAEKDEHGEQLARMHREIRKLRKEVNKLRETVGGAGA
jgi:voltage-gated potassium channel